jgi:CheY-like chemotaxis protein
MTPTELSGRGTRVLIIEDHPATAGVFRRLLELFGYDVRVAYTGPDGVRLAEEWLPNVVLCDIGLPGLDGWGVATALRRNPATAHARLIAVTAYDSVACKERSQEVGFECHLVKPVNPGLLLEMLATG